MNDRRSAEAERYRKWYGLKAWRTRRARQLLKVPYCERCKRRGLVVAATVANHNPPHRGDWMQFISGPLESLCAPCHDSSVQAEENRGFSRQPGGDGWPADANHPFNRQRD